MGTTPLINELLKESFEVSDEKMKPETHLFNDLGLDSLDAVDMLVLLESKLNYKLDGKKFLMARTLGDVYKIVEEELTSVTHVNA
jgi:acyl carrier protein